METTEGSLHLSQLLLKERATQVLSARIVWIEKVRCVNAHTMRSIAHAITLKFC